MQTQAGATGPAGASPSLVKEPKQYLQASAGLSKGPSFTSMFCFCARCMISEALGATSAGAEPFACGARNNVADPCTAKANKATAAFMFMAC